MKSFEPAPDILPAPNIEAPLTVLIFVPLTSISCLVASIVTISPEPNILAPFIVFIVVPLTNTSCLSLVSVGLAVLMSTHILLVPSLTHLYIIPVLGTYHVAPEALGIGNPS